MRRRLPIALEGLPFVVAGGLISTLGFLLGWPVVGSAFLVLTLFTLWFFRNPPRQIPPGETLIVSPADGRVVEVDRVEVPRTFQDKRLKVGIFLNVFNVHINRSPCAGRVSEIDYYPGKFLAAYAPKASLENERNALLIERTDGKQVLCVQIAGLIARRIVCWAKKGEWLEAGERFGMIRFGSRVDLFLPIDTEIRVRVGDRVKGGESIIGEFR